MDRRRRDVGAACCAAAFLFGGWVLTVHAQGVSESALKAAFLYSFAKFTDWPADHLPAAAPMSFCVADSLVSDALDKLVSGRSIGQHRTVVTRVKLDDVLRQCAVLYAGDVDTKRMDQLMVALNGSSVLSIGTSLRFVQTGGIVRLFLDDGQMRFAVNVDAADRARLHLSAQLLTLAKIIKDGTE